MSEDMDFFDDDSDDEIPDLMIDPEFDSKPKKNYEVLSVRQIVDMMSVSVDEVKNVVKLPSHVTRVLLNHFKWDKQKLFDRYFGFEEQLLSELNINDDSLRSNNSVNNDNIPIVKRKKALTCFICYNDIENGLLYSLCCDHEFCICKYFL
jgi:ariadne-1